MPFKIENFPKIFMGKCTNTGLEFPWNLSTEMTSKISMERSSCVQYFFMCTVTCVQLSMDIILLIPIPPKLHYGKKLTLLLLIILTCNWELSWIAQDAAQPDRVEAF